MSALNIVDLRHEEELSATEMARVIGGHDVEKEKALVELWGVIHSMTSLEDEPEPAPPHVPMKL
ncbi:hypothetical protein [Caballeronia sp. GAFFF1]|uniref:hypothetical protein n=1 Tax=Caballeronia sp. GAFFF1 TaxID=2921779 RepID=UPI0020294FB9|nr:hypothetical protein [Caballeronia sp. GAFFF1]